MYRRGITFPQMAVAMCLGTAGGVYIYGPYYRSQNPPQNPPQAQEPAGAGGQAPPPPAPPAEGAGPQSEGGASEGRRGLRGKAGPQREGGG